MHNTLLLLLILEPTFTSMYGILKHKDWFWDPKEASVINPFLAWRFSYNHFIKQFFGKTVMVVFNVCGLIFMWICILVLIFFGKTV